MKIIACYICGKEKLSKNEIGLNKKLIHPQPERMLCLKCLSTDLETTKEDLEELIKRFKQEGCLLFG